MLCSFISHYYGWTQGLTTVAASFAIGSTALFYGLKQVRKADQKLQTTKALQAGAIIGLSLATVCYLLQSSVYRPGLLAIIVVFSLLSFGLIYYNCTQQERQGLHKIMGYIACFALFCSLFEQAGSSITLFIEKAVDRHIFNYILPSSSLMSLNPIYILILGLSLPVLTKRFLEKEKPLESSTKMGIGFFFVSLSFAVLSFAASAYILQSFVPLPYILAAFLIQSIGELYIVPITLSNITKYAPARYLSILLSFWLTAIGYGHYLAGVLPSLFLRSTQDNILNYGHFFNKLSVISIIITLLLGIISYFRYIKNRSCHNKHLLFKY